MENTINQTAPDLQKIAVPHSKKAAQWLNRSSGALCLHFVISQLLQIIIMVIMMLGIVLRDGGVTDVQAVTQELTSGGKLLLLVFLSVVPANILGTVIGLAFIGKLKGSFKGMFSKVKISPALVLLAIPVTIGIQSFGDIFSILFQKITGSSGVEAGAMPEFISGDILNNVMLVLYVVLIGPLTEELIMRGMALKCSNYAGGMIAYAFSAFAFGMFHGNIIQGIFAFAIGMLFAWIDIKANSIWPSVILHVWNNGLAVLMMITYDKVGGIPDKYMYVYYGLTIAAGIACFVILRRKLAAVSKPASGFYAVEADVSKEEKKKCGISALLQCPCFYVFTVIYLALIIFNIVGTETINKMMGSSVN